MGELGRDVCVEARPLHQGRSQPGGWRAGQVDGGPEPCVLAEVDGEQDEVRLPAGPPLLLLSLPGRNAAPCCKISRFI